MGSDSNHVKQVLATARIHHRPELLQEVVEELLAAEGKAGTTLTELRVLCSEIAVELQQWQIAAQLLRGVGVSHETHLLRIRKIFCDVLVSLHEVDTNASLSEEQKVQEKLMRAATVLQTLAEGMEMWPDSVDAVLIGIRTLWIVIGPLFDAGRQAEVCDAVVFLASLHQQLRIGGGYTLIQWMARSALCLYAADRVAEAFAHFTTAMDAAALLSNQRLYVQLLRMFAGVVNAKEMAATSAKGRPELLGAYRGRPIVYAVLLTQLVFTGQVEVDTCREELHSTYAAIQSGNSEVVLSAEAAAAAGASAKGKKKAPAAKQVAPQARATEAFAVTDVDVIEEVKSDLLLCISLYDVLTMQEQEELERKRNCANRRVRSFNAYAHLVQEARQRGLAQLGTCADASVLTATHRSDAMALAQQLLSVLKGTNAIHDGGERQYTLHVGASLLWNYLLPFLQPVFAGDVQSALDAVLEVSEAAVPQLRQLFLQVGLQQCHIAYNEDNRSTLHHLLPVLKQECAHSATRGANANIEFPLQWMQYQLTVLDEPESSLTNEQDRCLFAIEQARTTSNPLKRIPFLKTAFQHLPPLLREESQPDVAAVTTASEAPSKHAQLQQQSQQLAAVSSPASVPVQRRSTVQLYEELLDLCMEDVTPSLYTVASAVAEALRTLPRPPPGVAVDDLEEMQAAACLHSATLQWRRLEDEVAGTTTGAATAATADTPMPLPGCSSVENQLASLLKETVQRGASLEARRAGSGGWVVANACITFLKMKQGAFAVGDYSTHVAELLELHATYAALFAKGRVQDVALLSDLSVAGVIGLLAGFLAAKASVAAGGSPNGPAGLLQGAASTIQDNTYTGLIHRIQSCTVVEASNAQLRKAEALSREALQLITAPKDKWFVAMLYPTVLRLLNEKPVTFLHPQEQLLAHLGVLAGPPLAQAQRQSLLEQEMRPLLRKDPSVRLCTWVATIAAELHLEDVVMECCQLADALYAAGRLGWDSTYDVQRPDAASATASSANNVNASNGFGGAGSGIANSGKNSIVNKKGSLSLVLVQREGGSPVKPDMDDWGAYAVLLAMKTLVGANHLQGLCGDIRRVALQQLLTTCVNSIIAAIHGPESAKMSHFTRAFGTYYSILRENNSRTLPLSDATFILPSLRMLLSNAILTKIPKREWSATFTELVYQLGTILVHVSYRSGRDEDVQQLATHLRLLRELLPPRYRKSLKLRETTEACYKNPSVEGFLLLSRNMEAELQTHGWLMVAQRAADECSKAEAFALALSGTQANAFARAQCLFELAYASLQQGAAPLTQAADQLREALRTLEGLPHNVPLLRDGAASPRNLNPMLVDKSLTASFLRTTRVRPQSGSDVPIANTTSTAVAVETPRDEKKGAAIRAPAKKTANQATATSINFQHVFLGLRIVALLFRVASPVAALATGTGATAARASSKNAAMASRRDCANVLLDYISCLWELCAKLVRDDSAPGEAAATQLDCGEGNEVSNDGNSSSGSSGANGVVGSAHLVLPESTAAYYGFVEPVGIAQRVRQLVPDEELQLNTEGVWQSLLELGDYLLNAGDEAHAFMVYSWLRFAAVVSLGAPESSAPCALVQRVCNLKMSLAATASGLSDAPYVAALQRLSETALPLDNFAVVTLSSSSSSSLPQPVLSAAPAWLMDFVIAECDTRVIFGQVEEAAALASALLLQRNTSATGAKQQEGEESLTNTELNGLRIVTLREVVRGHCDEALRIADDALQRVARHHCDAFESSSHFSVGTWVRLREAKLRALLGKKAVEDALQWVAATHQQLLEWRTAAAASLAAPRAAAALAAAGGAAQAKSSSSSTLRLLSLRGELVDAIQYWGKGLLTLATNLHPSFTALQLFPAFEEPLAGTAIGLFKELVSLMEVGETMFCRMYETMARWWLRDRVTPSWVAQYAESAKEHLCPRLMTLLSEMKTLQQLSDSLESAMTKGDVVGTPANPSVTTTALIAPRSDTTSTSFSFWQAFMLYWSAVDRLEAHRIVECLVGSFRRLSMTELQLPTTDAPAHLEKEVLKFIRGVGDSDAAPVEDAATATLSPTYGKVGARWQHTPQSAMTEIEQALQHYELPVHETKAVMDLSSTQSLIQQSFELSRPWSFSRLAKDILITLAELEVLRLTENQVAAADDMLGEKLNRQREAVLTAAWNRTPLVPLKTDKATSRACKSLLSGKQHDSNEASEMLPTPVITAEEDELLQRITDGAAEAVRFLHLDLAEQLFDHLSSLAILLGHPRLAAAAAEQLQACQLIGFLLAKSTLEMADSVEGRLWRQLACIPFLLRGATASKALMEEALTVSPMGRYIRSCASLCVDEKKDENAVPPTSPQTREAAAAEASPFVTDAPVLTIALSSSHVGYCLVLLRHPDGSVEGRRGSFAEAEWRPLAQQFEAVQRQMSELLGGQKCGRLGSAAQRTTSEDAAGVLDLLSAITSRLLLDFQPSLQSFGAKSALYLCLAPCVQAIAWEQSNVLSACAVVVRELGAAAVVCKYGEASRTVRGPSTHGSKPTGPGSQKGAPAGPSVCIIDAFGDHTESIENVLNAEPVKARNTQQFVVTCSSPGAPPDPAYLAWVLNASAPSSVVVDMCGSLTDVLPLPQLAALRLSQVNAAVMADGAVNTDSRQREERQRLGGRGGGSGGGVVSFVPPRWMVQLLLLLRGARFVVASALPCSPDVSDSLTRRCLSSLSSAKALVEQLKGKAKDVKTPQVTLYGFLGSSGNTKQKA